MDIKRSLAFRLKALGAIFFSQTGPWALVQNCLLF